MPILKADIEKLSLEGFTWDSIVEGADKELCYRYGSACKTEVTRYQDKNEDLATIYGFLQAIFYIMLKPEDTNGPFVPMMSSGEGRTSLPSDLSEGELNVLESWVGQSGSREIDARLADIIWLRRRNPTYGQTAINSYLTSAKTLAAQEEWAHVPDRIGRAIEIAARMSGKGNDLLTPILESAAALVKEQSDESPPSGVLKLLSILIDRKHGDDDEWAEAADNFADCLAKEGKHSISIKFRELKERVYRRSDNKTKLNDTLAVQAESYVLLAEAATSQMAKSSHLRSALEVLRRVSGSGSDERFEEIQAQFLTSQKLALGELGQFSTDVDLGELPDVCISAVRGKSLEEALLTLAMIGELPNRENLESEAEKHAKEFPIQFMFRTEILNDDGGVIAIKPGGMEDPDGAMRAIVHESVSRTVQLVAVGKIEPARGQILFENRLVNESDILPLVTHNPFVPHDRRITFAKGLVAGLKGDFIVASHLLIPQLENSIRRILKNKGIVTTGLDAKTKRQEEMGLNIMLTKYSDEFAQVLGEDTVLALQNTLIERFGANLRNTTLHGLVSDYGHYSYASVYVWWLTLRLCCIAYHNSRRPISPDDSHSTSGGDTSEEPDDT